MTQANGGVGQPTDTPQFWDENRGSVAKERRLWLPDRRFALPKIDAPTVAEHRAAVKNRLVDAAEEILRSGEPGLLTAAMVTQAAGIARNSIYRYVDSVDDLHGLVLSRYLPAWLEAVGQELESVDDPAERITVWVRANLLQAAHSGHGWLMGLGTANPTGITKEVMDSAHTIMRDALAKAWLALISDPTRARVAAGLTRGLLEAGFKQLDAGIDVDVVAGAGADAAAALVVALRD